MATRETITLQYAGPRPGADRLSCVTGVPSATGCGPGAGFARVGALARRPALFPDSSLFYSRVPAARHAAGIARACNGPQA